MTEKNNKDGTFLYHLQEMRKCLIKSLLALLIGFGSTAYFSKEIYAYLASPLASVLPEGSYFIAVHPFEGWVTYLKTALIAGFFIALPYIFWQVWMFVAPGLYKNEKRWVLVFVILTSVLFMVGAFFGYFYVFPYAFEFFTSVLQDTSIVFLPQMNSYLGFSFKLLLAFGVIFELPLIVFVVAMTGLVSLKKLFAFQKYMIVVSFIIAALLTPPDVITQIIMGIPMILLYELGLFCAWLFKRNKKD
ncbi:MAG: twin-arginine translocase subunit TatC [bacterium]|nr:twin-arginine translocase subunit TatC [bacterium]MBU1916518.1 twin-arginine translocase subunit TatC [bacterium]